MSAAASTRVEKDLLGKLEVPADAYYGIQTLRAVQNFRLSGVPLSHYPKLVIALAMVKQAAADANRELGHLSAAKHTAISTACARIIQGEFHDQFVVDMIQGGAGTSTNMNANEVIANIALEAMGHEKGEYQHLHPNNDVNMAQSTNDAYPTAIRVGLLLGHDFLLTALDKLIQSFAAKGLEFGRRAEDGPHPAAGRRTHDPGPGIPRLRHHPGRRPAAPQAHGADPAHRSEPGRHRHRHRHQRRSGLPEARRRAPGDHQRPPGSAGGRPDRSHLGHGRLRAVLRHAQAHRGQAVEDLQRPAPALQRPAHRHQRDQPAGRASRAARSCRARSTR